MIINLNLTTTATDENGNRAETVFCMTETELNEYTQRMIQLFFATSGPNLHNPHVVLHSLKRTLEI
jgi:hypothetical protein